MAGQRSHLIKRNAVYYWRRRIPTRLVPSFSKTHLVKSTNLVDLTAASRLGRLLSVVFDRFLMVMEAPKRVPTKAEVEALLSEIHLILHDRYELRRALLANIDPPGEQRPSSSVPSSQTSAPEAPSEPARDLTKAEVDELYRKVQQEYEAEQRHFEEHPEAREEYEAELVRQYRELDAFKPGYMDALDATHDLWRPEQTVEEWHAALARNDLTPVMFFLDSVLAERGFTLPHDSVAYRQAAIKVLRIGAKALEGIEHAFLRLSDWQMRTEVARAQPDRIALPTIDHSRGLPRLTTAIDRFRTVKKVSDWGSKSARDAEVAFRFMCDFFGDISMDEIRKSRARDFVTALDKVPSQHGKSPFIDQRRKDVAPDPTKPTHKNRARFDYTPLPMQKLIQIADDIEQGIEIGDPDFIRFDGKPWIEDDAVKRLSLKTQNKYITFAHGLFDFVLEEADISARNPFDNLLHSKAAVERDQGEGRKVWPKDILSILFLSPVWSGCLSANRRSSAGQTIIRYDKFWVPLLGAFAGLRLEEACQLKVDDVNEIVDLHCIAVRRGQNQRVKNSESIREIPVHRKLIDIGFLDFVNEMRRRGETWLFPELEPAGPHRVRGYTFSKWFTEYRRSVGLYEPWLDFHSLRHSFITNLKLRKQPVDQIEALVGHTRKGMTSRVYFKGFAAKDINETVQALDYGIDLRHLIQTR